ncbi:MAG: hypothetical protein JJU02_12075 [Cryomorphaceae bacterium]|nr:hypothetical protein [Cryomorphaceae bacterium]
MMYVFKIKKRNPTGFNHLYLDGSTLEVWFIRGVDGFIREQSRHTFKHVN